MPRILFAIMITISSQFALAREINPEQFKFPLQLGVGFDHGFMKDSGNYCVQGQQQFRRLSSAAFHYAFDEASDDLKNYHGGSANASGQVGFGLISGSAEAEFFAKSAASDYSSSSIRSFEYIAGVKTLVDVKPSSTGFRLLKSTDAGEIRHQCGDAFISQVQLGAQLYIAVIYTFMKREDHEYFKQTVTTSALWGLSKSSHTSVKGFDQIGKAGYVEIAAFQTGGNERMLVDLMASRPSFCDMANLTPCLDTLAAVAQYAQKELPSQLTGSGALKTLRPLNYTTTSYTDAGIPLTPGAKAPNAADLQLAVHRLHAAYSQALLLAGHCDLLQHTVDSPNIREACVTIKSNLTTLKNAVDRCVDGSVAVCLDQTATALAKVIAVDPARLEGAEGGRP